MKRLFAPLAIAIVAASGCGGGGDQASTASSAATATSAASTQSSPPGKAQASASCGQASVKVHSTTPVDVPANAVALVDGQPITKASYDHWAAITARGGAANGCGGVVPDPPSYAKCIAALRKQATGQPKPSPATLQVQCKRLDTQVAQQTMTTLIQTAWVEGEAKKQGVTVSSARVQKQLAKTKTQSFPTAAAYEKFLKQSGMTQTEVMERARVQALSAKLQKKIQHSGAPVTKKRVSSYYNQHKAQFVVPERRDLEIILTKTKAQAKKAKVAVKSGTSWAVAARKYSIDTTSKANGGVLDGVVKGQENKALDQAAFSAKKGVIVGPVHSQFGWYVVKVLSIAPAKPSTLAQATAQIRELFAQQGEMRAAKFFADFQKRWRRVTKCRAGYVVPLCKNAPK